MLNTRPDDERQDERFSTYSDRLVLGPSGKKFTVWAKADTPNVKVVRVIRRFIDQNAVQESVSVRGSAVQYALRKPNHVLAPVFVS